MAPSTSRALQKRSQSNTLYQFIWISIILLNNPVFSWTSTPTLPFSYASTSLNMGATSDTEGQLLLSTFSNLQNKNVQIILASQSPRRAEILDMMGLKGQFIATPSPLDESKLQTELQSRADPPSPVDYVKLLSSSKAGAMADSLIESSSSNDYGDRPLLILGSDTIVDLDGIILEKPVDKVNACEMLEKLSGSWHCVHTGVAIYYLPGTRNEKTTPELLSSFVETTKVKFVELTQRDIESYVETGEPMDKAGSYGIQGIGGQMVEQINGDYFTVMGFPMHRLSVELAKISSALTD